MEAYPQARRRVMSVERVSDPGDYTAASIQVLRGCEHIRLRPGMYVGDRREGGVFHTVLSLVGFCLDNADLPQDLEITLLPEDGIRIHCQRLSFPECQLEPLALRWVSRFRADRPRLAFFLQGVGFSVANALSRSLVIDSYHAGTHWRQQFARGTTRGPLECVGPSSETAVTITFYPDPEIFEQTTIPRERLVNLFRELAALLPNARFTLSGPGEGRQEFHSPGGLVDLLVLSAGGLTPVCGPITDTIETEEGRASIAFAWYAEADETIRAYCNGGRVLRGEYLRGVRHALTRYSDSIGQRLRSLRDSLTGGRVTIGDIVRKGFVAVIAFELAEPFYNSPTRDSLNNTEAYRLALALVRQCLEGFARSRHEEAREVEAFLVSKHVDPKTGTA
jgi:DNA gyrase subunit B